MQFVSYAQNLEDVMLWRALRHVENGFYIDVGANDPEVDSVTKAFYDRGWNGINIEPLQSHYNELLQKRPRDINLNVLVGDKVGEVKLFECEIRGWATADITNIERLISLGHTGQFHNVPITTLTNICQQYVLDEIHFLKIDVEGFEKAVIDGIDLQHYRPWILVIEAMKPNSNIPSYKDWEPFLLESGYKFAYLDGINRFYVANEHLDLLSDLINPPNVLDQFATAAHVSAEERLREAVIEIDKLCQYEAWINDFVSSWLYGFLTKVKLLKRISAIENHSGQVQGSKFLKKIAVDLTPIIPGGENGGAKIFVLELLRQLAKIAPQTEFVLLTQAQSHDELYIMDSPNVRRLQVINSLLVNSMRPTLQKLVSKLLPTLPRRLQNIVNIIIYKLNSLLKRHGAKGLLKTLDADLLFCPFTAPTYFEHGIPTVCIIYDLQYKTYPEFFAVEDVAHRDRTFSEACRKASMLVAISNYTRVSAIEHGEINPSAIRTVYIRMPQTHTFNKSNNEFLFEKLGISQQKYLIYPANFWKHKNHEMLLTAFGQACTQGLPEDIKLVCTGASILRQEWLMLCAREMKLADRIIFPGYLSSLDLKTLMENARGMVFPSLYEGFGMPIIEAMAAGVPVACSNVTSLPEIADNAAFLFDPRIPEQISSALISLVRDNDVRVANIKYGLKRATNFADSDLMAREYWDIFNCALTNNVNKTF